MLGLFRGIVLESQEGAFNVAWHADVAGALVVVPRNGEAAVACALQVHADRVEKTQGCEKMVGRGLFSKLNAKVVDNERERDVVCVVFP